MTVIVCQTWVNSKGFNYMRKFCDFSPAICTKNFAYKKKSHFVLLFLPVKETYRQKDNFPAKVHSEPLLNLAVVTGGTAMS